MLLPHGYEGMVSTAPFLGIQPFTAEGFSCSQYWYNYTVKALFASTFVKPLLNSDLTFVMKNSCK